MVHYGLGLAAGDGGVDHLHALLGAGRRDFLAGAGGDGAHIDEGSAGLCPLQHAVFAADHGLHVGGVGQHGDDDSAALGHRLGGRSRLCTRGHHVVDIFLHHIEDRELVARLHEVLRHGLAHDTQPDKADFHCVVLLISAVLLLSSRYSPG